MRMPGLFPESHLPILALTGDRSAVQAALVVESSDVYLFAGPLFSDYTTTGYTSLINNNKLINVGPDRVTMPGGAYNGWLCSIPDSPCIEGPTEPR